MIRNFLTIAALGGAVLMSGCGHSIPAAYRGDFSGAASGQQVALNIDASQIAVVINGKSQTVSNYVDGFKDVVSAAENSQGGLYVMPTVESEEGIPVNSPWVPRMDLSTIGYGQHMQESKRYLDFYAVIPLDPSQAQPPFDLGSVAPIPLTGTVGEFDAFVVYAQIDTQASGKMSAVDVQVAPEARIAAEDTDLLGVVKTKMLSITPGPQDNPVDLTATLSRN